MTKEQIEKAARKYAFDNAWYPGETSYESDIRAMEESFADAFMDGAQWRINSAWHDGAASCEARRKALVLFDNGSAKVYEDLRELSVERLWGYVDRFAYLDDLLPDGGKEVTK